MFCVNVSGHYPSLTYPDEIITPPSATVSPDENEIITFSVDANGTNRTLQLNCSGTGDLTWYRGDTPPAALSENLITLLNNGSVLILSISPIINNVDASHDGIPYYCVANNSLGSARSRTVIVKYACEFEC